jgi:hypothetical protein
MDVQALLVLELAQLLLGLLRRAQTQRKYRTQQQARDNADNGCHYRSVD